MKKLLLGFTLVLAASICIETASAQHDHGDIEFGYDSGQIFLETGELTDASSDAHRLFEGNFPTTGTFERFTTDPGFASEVSEGLGVGANDTIGINVIQSSNYGSYLTYYDPTANMIMSSTATITLKKGPTSLDITDMMGGLFTIAQADGSGNVHAHIDFSLSEGADVGAYGILFNLTTDAVGIDDSESVWVVFNYGMDEEQFETQALAAYGISAVPEPSSAMALSLLGLGLVAARRGKRS